MRTLSVFVALTLAALAGSPAFAQDAPLSPDGAAEAGAPSEHGAPLSLEDLQQVNGRQGVQTTLLSEQQLSATSTGNTVTANTIRSGDVAFSSGALQGFSGVGNFVINTGNNNNLQGAISVSIITTPPL